MSKPTIKKVAVLGSGVMGSRIACHFANIGCEVLLMDIVPRELNPEEEKKGLTLENGTVRNRIVNDSLAAALKSNPSPIYLKSFASRIQTGNFEDDMPKIKDCDWVIEVVVERLDIKKIIFEQVEKYRKPGTLITSNTSGIPIHLMTEGRSDDFKAHFFGTHFFNPPRYLQLLEVIPSPHTKPELIDFMIDYGVKYLGKRTVLCKDTPAFIANRIGVFSIISLFHTVQEMGMTVDEVDKLSGPVLGRPKSATFRTCDVVGMDTLIHVANGVRENCPNDEANASFELPDYIKKMAENNWLGDKTGKGFYKKSKDENGKRVILSLNLQTMEYEAQQKVKFPTLEMTKPIEDLRQRMKMLFNGMDKAGEFYRKTGAGLFSYVSHRIPEITDELYKIDDAMRAGFAWELGPFEMWDTIGVDSGIKIAEKEGKKLADWIYAMRDKGITAFYKFEGGKRYFYDIPSQAYQVIPGSEDKVNLDALRAENVVWKNSDTTLVDLGDGILNLEFHTKMNTIGGGVIEGLNKAVDIAEKSYKGLVVSNTGQNFSAGANVGMIFMMAIEQDYDELDFAIRAFQNTMMRMRYSNIPVVAAPHNLTLGGGCELIMHSDKVIAHSESYIGLVEFGVGLIPGGGGTKEFVQRLSQELHDGDIRINRLRDKFLTIGQAKVATSAYEAFELGYLREGTDEVIVSREYQLTRAKEACLELANKGYQAPIQERNIEVLGQEGLGIVYVGANSMLSGNYISEHDALISEKLGTVMCGGDLSERTKVSPQYLLDLERKAFLELCREKKTLERIESIVKYGKILRN
jgi:3-hydroxyacyl-CoA dehydrogenase